MVTADSIIVVSTSWPRPIRSRANRAAMMALADIMAVAMSITEGPARTASWSGKPFIEMKPLSACTIGSKPIRPAAGPLRP